MADSPTSQMHGKSFENMIKAANGIFTYAAADRERLPGDKFDIQAEDDNDKKIPTSIKASKGNSIGLSDARAFWHSFNFVPYRVIIGIYTQEKGIKKFAEVHELIIKEKYKKDLLGDVTEETVTAFHDGLRRFGPGREEQAKAQKWAKEMKRTIAGDVGLVILNPKIDSKNQRRLQCSFNLTEVKGLLDKADYTLHTEQFGNLVLPVSIVSESRRFRNGA